jgi:hypothetical protein
VSKNEHSALRRNGLKNLRGIHLGKNIDVKRVIFGKMSLKKVTCKNID